MLEGRSRAVLCARDALQRTQLHLAAACASGECLALLLAAGADVRARARNGATPLHVAALLGRSECAELLLRAGADKEACTIDGRAALSTALASGHSLCAELLLRDGARVAATDLLGWTPLHIAAVQGLAECAEGASPADVAATAPLRIRLRRAELAARMAPLTAAAARGALFDSRMFDVRLWRLVARFVAAME